MTGSHRANAAESVEVLTLMKITTTTRMMHIIGGVMIVTGRSDTEMSDACMIDVFEECFHDCPNCPQNGFRSGVYIDEYDNIDDDDDDEEDEFYGD